MLNPISQSVATTCLSWPSILPARPPGCPPAPPSLLQGLANLVWGLGLMGQRPPQPWLRALYSATSLRLEAFTAQGLAMWVQGAAKLHLHVPPHLLDQLMRWAGRGGAGRGGPWGWGWAACQSTASMCDGITHMCRRCVATPLHTSVLATPLHAGAASGSAAPSRTKGSTTTAGA